MASQNSQYLVPLQVYSFKKLLILIIMDFEEEEEETKKKKRDRGRVQLIK